MRALLLLAASLLILGCSGQKAAPAAGCACPADVSLVCGSDNQTYNSSCLARCANATVVHGGQCIVCSGGGKDPLVKGTASAAGLSYTDECVNFTAVTKYYCNGDLISKAAVDCPKGYECQDGACAVPQPPAPGECHDSDGGPDPYTRGTVTISGASYTDSCTPDKQLLEYDCSNGTMTQAVSPCPSGSKCDSGRCLKGDLKCQGTSNKSDIFTAGDLNVSVNLVQLEFLDKCLDNQTLRKYYCVGDDYNSEDVTCPPDYQCLNAACRQIACTSTNDGINIYKSGAVNKGTQVYRDTCNGSNGGTKYYCEGNQVKSASFDCPDGYFCSDGRCTR